MDSRGFEVVVWVAVLGAALVFILAGLAKLDPLDAEWIGRFERWGYRPSFVVTIGVLELAGAIGLIVPASSVWAALGLLLIMCGAIGTHVSEHEWLAAIPAATMVAVLGFVLVARSCSGRRPRG
jgi:uncharacterized membrane protein YphA (DoxX/SURF4 family)